jgi:hypothetical protein
MRIHAALPFQREANGSFEVIGRQWSAAEGQHNVRKGLARYGMRGRLAR